MKNRKIKSIQHQLFLRIRGQVADRLGLQDGEIRNSEKSFRRFFSGSWQKSTHQSLQSRIEESDVVFWGDFHGVRQYQNNLLRWLKKQDLKEKPIVLALECLPSSTQKKVDEYLRGRITETEFLEKVKWNKIWSFPWSHYKPLFDWARENKQLIKMINGPKAKSPSRQREAWGVKQILKIRRDMENCRIFVLYGEYHLLPNGFPALVRRKTKLRYHCVFQNSDVLYFRKPPKSLPARIQPLKSQGIKSGGTQLAVTKRQVATPQDGEVFKRDDFYSCIQNVAPWVKWQNFNLFLEASQDTDFEEDLDLTEHVLGVSETLAKTLDLPLDGNRLAVFTSAERGLWEHLKKIPDAEFAYFKNLMESQISFVYSPGGWIFLGRISANETAAIAMQSLLFQFNESWSQPFKENDTVQSRLDFLIWIQAFGYFGSKLLNPHRKTADLLGLQKKARSLSGRPIERQAARLAVHYLLHQSLGNSGGPTEISYSSAVYFQAVKWISGQIGEKLFNAFHQGDLSLANLKAFMKKNPQDKNFHLVIQSLYEIIDR